MNEDDEISMEGRKRRAGSRAASARGLLPSWKNVAVAGLVLVALLFGFTAYFALTIPISEEPRPGARGNALVLADNEGEVFDTRGVFRGRRVTLSELPPYVPAAVIAIEDRRFYSHFGVDPIGLARALVVNIAAGDIRQGGSTITQQLARVLYLSPEQTITRKIHELMIALWLETRFTKDEILARYLNEVYFGGGAYGIDGAAHRYFGKPATELTLSEAAMLAGLVKAPSALSPTVNMEGARARASVVLRAMVETGAATREAAEAARKNPATLAVDTEEHPGRHYFSDWVSARAEAMLNPGPGTLKVTTTLDPALQNLAEKVVDRHFDERSAELNAGQVSLVSMTPDGAVLAMIGGRDYEESQFNRATRAMRQPGSLFKVFVYLAALDAGFRPEDTFVDKPIAIDGWTPENYSDRYRGRVTLKTALAKSINSVAVQLADEVGIDNVISMARRLGITTDLRRDLSLALGTSEVTLLEMTAAFAGIANGGELVTPYGIEEIKRGENMIRLPDRGTTGGPGEAVLPWKRDQMMEMMRAVVTSGTGRRAAFDWPAAGKTGTSQNYRDAWFIGFTDHLITGVWIGNDDNSPMNNLTGGELPAEIWRDFMAEAHAIKDFPRPRPEPRHPPRSATARAEPRIEQQPERPAAPPPRTRESSFERDLRRLGDAILSIFD